MSAEQSQQPQPEQQQAPEEEEWRIQANAFKADGNAAFQCGDYEGAVRLYSQVCVCTAAAILQKQYNSPADTTLQYLTYVSRAGYRPGSRQSCLLQQQIRRIFENG